MYEEPRYLPGGDRYLLVELGNEMTLELNFLAQGRARAIDESCMTGVIETAPCFATLLVHYDPDKVSYSDLCRELRAVHSNLGSVDDIEVESRLFTFETMYLDPWTEECIRDYCKNVVEKEYDADFVARINGLEDANQLVRVHSATEYWVAALGFYPGVAFTMPLDPRSRLTAPKYNPPRTQTPQGAVGMGGACTCIYPAATPGGYQIFGRTPVPIWDTQSRYDVFGGEVVLFRAGDRNRYVPVDLDQFKEVEARISEGTYVYNVAEYQKFSLRQYKSWVSTIDATERF